MRHFWFAAGIFWFVVLMATGANETIPWVGYWACLILWKLDQR